MEKNILIDKLQKLTQEDYIKIASIAEPNVKWKLAYTSHKWNGIDLVEDDCKKDTDSKYIFQIDYRNNDELTNENRFRLYIDLHEYFLDVDKIKLIINYLKSI